MSTPILSLLTRALDRNGIDPTNLNTTTTDPLLIAMSRKYCTPGKCPQAWQVIAYRPNMAGTAIYTTCFAFLLLAQAWFGMRHKTWKYTVTMCVGIAGETIGYIGRVQLSLNPFLMSNFLV